MINGTMSLIQTVSVPAGGQPTIAFTDIPQTYDDLQVVFSIRTNKNAINENVFLAFNGSTSNFTARWFFGDGNNGIGNSSTARLAGFGNGDTATSNTFGTTQLYVPNYRASATKTYSADTALENNSTTAFLGFVSGAWSNNAPITSITLTPETGTLFLQHSTAYLYGITRVPNGAKASGGVVYSDASHWYHVFTSSGTFTPSQSLALECLVVAGGGGGGTASGGGGAGGVLYKSSHSVTSGTNYTATVGGGGAVNANGTDSVFDSTVVATGGGRGGSAGVGSNGGSGGGGSGYTGGAVSTRAGGTATQTSSGGTTGYGNNGGAGDDNAYRGGGGGGSGAAGTASTSSQPGNGGNGTAAFSTWLAATQQGENVNGTWYIAGGGGGGGYWNEQGLSRPTGGFGGGALGSGRLDTAGSQPAKRFTGSGGSGSSDSPTGNGSAGASGIIIIRYPK